MICSQYTSAAPCERALPRPGALIPLPEMSEAWQQQLIGVQNVFQLQQQGVMPPCVRVGPNPMSQYT